MVIKISPGGESAGGGRSTTKPTLLRIYLNCWIQFFQVFLSVWTSSFEVVTLNSYSKKKNIRKSTQNALVPSMSVSVTVILEANKLRKLIILAFHKRNWERFTVRFNHGKLISKLLREAWTDHCFTTPFSWFLHETGVECLKITSPRCFSLKCQKKDSKKVKEHRQFRGVLGRWRTAAIDRTTCHACQQCRKTAVFAVFPRLWGVIWRGKAFGDQQC